MMGLSSPLPLSPSLLYKSMPPHQLNTNETDQQNSSHCFYGSFKIFWAKLFIPTEGDWLPMGSPFDLTKSN